FSAFLPHHYLCYSPGDQESAAEIDIHDFVEIFVGHPNDGLLAAGDSRTVNKNIYPSEFVCNFLNGAVHGFGVAHVHRLCRGLYCEGILKLFRYRLAPQQVSRNDREIGPCFSVDFGKSQPYSPIAAGNEDYFPFHGKQLFKTFSSHPLISSNLIHRESSTSSSAKYCFQCLA